MHWKESAWFRPKRNASNFMNPITKKTITSIISEIYCKDPDHIVRTQTTKSEFFRNEKHLQKQEKAQPRKWITLPSSGSVKDKMPCIPAEKKSRKKNNSRAAAIASWNNTLEIFTKGKKRKRQKSTPTPSPKPKPPQRKNGSERKISSKVWEWGLGADQLTTTSS